MKNKPIETSKLLVAGTGVFLGIAAYLFTKQILFVAFGAAFCIAVIVLDSK